MPQPEVAGTEEVIETPVTVADTEETSVDTTEESEQDIMSVLMEDEEVEDTDRSVPENVFLKEKSKRKKYQKELEELRLLQSQPKLEVPATELPNMPNPQDFDDGVHDPKYQAASLEYQTKYIEERITKGIQEGNKKLETDSYINQFRTRLESSLPLAEKRLHDYLKDKPEVETAIRAPYFQKLLSEIPVEPAAEISESPHNAEILTFYAQKPDKLLALTKGHYAAIIEFGKMLGKIESFKGRKPSTTPIAPLKSGETKTKLHPIKDHAKYDHESAEGKAKWNRDRAALNKGG